MIESKYTSLAESQPLVCNWAPKRPSIVLVPKGELNLWSDQHSSRANLCQTWDLGSSEAPDPHIPRFRQWYCPVTRAGSVTDATCCHIKHETTSSLTIWNRKDQKNIQGSNGEQMVYKWVFSISYRKDDLNGLQMTIVCLLTTFCTPHPLCQWWSPSHCAYGHTLPPALPPRLHESHLLTPWRLVPKSSESKTLYFTVVTATYQLYQLVTSNQL